MSRKPTHKPATAWDYRDCIVFVQLLAKIGNGDIDIRDLREYARAKHVSPNGDSIDVVIRLAKAAVKASNKDAAKQSPADDGE